MRPVRRQTPTLFKTQLSDLRPRLRHLKIARRALSSMEVNGIQRQQKTLVKIRLVVSRFLKIDINIYLV